MKPLTLLLFVSFFLCSNVHPLVAASGSTPAAQPMPKILLGMTASEVRQKIGTPVEVKKVPFADRTAECWLYRRILRQDQHEVSSSDRPMAEADEGCMTQPPQFLPVYTLESARLEQVTILYVVDDRLVASKQWHERSVQRELY